MEFRQFRYILTVAQEGSISRAAQKLYISQPSLSQSIAGIEKKLGAPLFDRSLTPLRPTPLGELYLDTARRILTLDEEFQQRADDMLQRSAGHIIIGSSPFRSTYLLSRFLPAFQRQYPSITVELLENTTRQLEELALAGQTDVILSLQPIDTSHFMTENLFAEDLLLALPPMHPLSQHYSLPHTPAQPLPQLPLAALKDTPFITMHPEQKLHSQLYALCHEAGFTPQSLLETRSLETALSLSGAGLGAALLPAPLIEGFRPQEPPCYAAIDTHPQRQVVIAWRRNRYLSHAARTFVGKLKAYCQQQ